MRIRDKNPLLKGLITAHGTRKQAPVYAAAARLLNRPRRVRHEVNVSRISRFAKPQETVLVPGPVLAAGEIDKPVTVAALKFSRSAAEKIARAGGSALTIEELAKKRPDGTGVRILG